MKKSSTVFLQGVVVLIGLIALALLAWFPLTEGRAANLNVFQVYADPFILFGYLASLPFFVALYQAFTLLGHIGRNNVFSLQSVKTLRIIKQCAAIVAASIVLAALYVRVSVAGEEDSAGFMAMSIVTTFISVVVATIAGVFEKTLQSAVELKSENDLTV
jgi:hypothetical protein